jgi:hypothetical protein
MKVRNYMRYCILLFAMMQLSSSWAMPQTLATIVDPQDDDVGADSLIYPQRSDFLRGGLDLLQLQISRDRDGFWFDAKFNSPIRSPAGVMNPVGSESLANFARKGFYQFNLDVYVDVDRVPGSGRTDTLSGRHVKIDPGYAWEKAVILTPRPELMRQQLLDATAEQYPEQGISDIEARVDRAIYFPTRIQVRGRTIRYFVPAQFFDNSDGTDWAIVSFVTGALTNIPADLSLLPPTKVPLERIELGVMQPSLGRPQDTFGYHGVAPSPVVDLLASSAGQQFSQLAAKELKGIAWGPHADTATLPQAISTAATIETATSVMTTPSSVESVQEPLDLPNVATQQTTLPSQRSIADRLKELQQLRDQQLIDDNEYRQQRQRILKEL